MPTREVRLDAQGLDEPDVDVDELDEELAERYPARGDRRPR